MGHTLSSSNFCNFGKKNGKFSFTSDLEPHLLSTGVLVNRRPMTYFPGTSLWWPGQSCPVPGCGALRIRTSTKLRQHWNEKHEDVVPKYHCSLCPYLTKRKTNLFMHFRSRHKEGDILSCIGKVNHQKNKQFLDPSPLTLDSVLGSLRHNFR